MNNLKRSWLSKSLFIAAAVLTMGALEAEPTVYRRSKSVLSGGGDIRRTPTNAAGVSTAYEVADAVGEGFGGQRSVPEHTVVPAGSLCPPTGYCLISGFVGTTNFGKTKITQLSVEGSTSSSGVARGREKNTDAKQLLKGVPLQSGIHVRFASADESGPVAVYRIQDHMGKIVREKVRHVAISSTLTSITLEPKNGSGSRSKEWLGNTLYEVSPVAILGNDVDDQGDPVVEPLSSGKIFRFWTTIDPTQDNRILYGLEDRIAPVFAAPQPNENAKLQLDIAAGSLSTPSFLDVDESFDEPSIEKAITEANRKAEQNAGPYRRPLAIYRFSGVDDSGNALNQLAKPALVTLSYPTSVPSSSPSNTPPPVVRPETLALFSLDPEHELWVRLSSTQNNVAAQTLSTPMTQFPVFAVMGSPAGDASETYVYPNPWRPNGPHAGNLAGQSGTETNGITFAFLPSESTIKIYTLSGEWVRTLHHSDAISLTPQEKWDVRNQAGEKVASGVYLWRVESASDAKNGKLMVIR